MATASQNVSVPPDRLVVGFSRGTMNPATPGKSVFIDPVDVGRAWAAMSKAEQPRGVMFWNMANDAGPVNGTQRSVSFARGFNKFLHVRP